MLDKLYIKEIYKLLSPNEKYKVTQTICNIEVNKEKIRCLTSEGKGITSIEQIHNYKLEKIMGKLKRIFASMSYTSRTILLKDFVFRHDHDKY
ncbi:UNVERIFIED_CONTAM: hypothetical protein O8I53_05830 [Campylobacter lari]